MNKPWEVNPNFLTKLPKVSMRFMFLPYLACHASSYAHISQKQVETD